MKSALKPLVGGSITAIEIFASWADSPRCTLGRRTAELLFSGSDDDFRPGVPFFDVSNRSGRIRQRILSVDHRS